MEYYWRKVSEELPLTYLTGNWDGKNSDQVVVIDSEGNYNIAFYCDGILDGHEFGEWYDKDEFEIKPTPEFWTELPTRP